MSSVEFLVSTFAPQVEAACYDLDQRFGIDSRLPGRTRADHLPLAAQIMSALARARQAQELADLVGPSALGETDRSYLAFADACERDLLDQRPDESRDLTSTLERAWRALLVLPRRELVALPADLLDARLSDQPKEG